MKNILTMVMIFLLMLSMTGMSQASLVSIGTASYDGSGYNLIWDNDNNGNSLIWLDYTHEPATRSDQMAWAAGLDGQLTNINTPGWTISWNDTAWRLPSIGTNPQPGYDQHTSEMGHLYYDELGLQSYPDRGNTLVTDAELNASNFDNLSASTYWYGSTGTSWYFDMQSGSQWGIGKDSKLRGLAVRSGQVSAVPVPGAIWLLGSGLFGLVTIRRRKAKA